MAIVTGASAATDPPSPAGVRSYDDLAERLRALRAWAGMPYRELHRRVMRSRRAHGVAELPAYDTIHRCFQPGRKRLDAELVVDIVAALLNDRARIAEWRQACQVVEGRASDASIVSVVATLPHDLDTFTGRRTELSRLLCAVGDSGGTVVISALEGMAGVGKTQLAVRAAHELVSSGRFGEVCLWVNLRGYDADLPPAEPAAVLDGFLRQLGVQGSRLAGLGLAARAALFRDALAGRRALVVLDNAASAEQVRPLLPNGSGCQVLVTSRRRLNGLSATHVPLDVFMPEESLELLRRAAGNVRFERDPDSAARIAELVGHLPLALALVASRIEATPDWTLADHLDRLAERRETLRLDDGVQIALGLSYDDLADGHRRLLRLLSLHPGRDFDAYAAAALAGSDLASTKVGLTGLVDASLLQQHARDRYELHDLVRVYAADRTSDEDAARSRRAALSRLFDHYRYVSWTAAVLHAPHEKDRLPTLAEPGTPCPGLADRTAAVGWLALERANLIASAVHAATRDWPEHAADLSLMLFRYLNLAGHHDDAETLHSMAAQVATGHKKGRALSNLGVVYLTSGRHREALVEFGRAVEAYLDCGDSYSAGAVRGNMGGAALYLGRYADAVRDFRMAIETARQTGDRVLEARALGNVAVANYLLGHYAEALDDCHATLELAARNEDRVVEHHALIQAGAVYERLGRYPEALDYLHRGLALARDVGHRLAEADALNQLGVVHSALGAHHRALVLQQRALRIVRVDGNAEIEVQVLNRMGPPLVAIGQAADALEQYQRALAIATKLANRYEQALALDGIGLCLARVGEYRAARSHLARATALYDELGTPQAGRLR